MAASVQVVVWGATGVTGKRVCFHLAERYHVRVDLRLTAVIAHLQDAVKWAIAGRSEQKLNSLRAEVAQKYPNCKDIPIITASVSDRASIDAMVKQAEVVIACAGPFSEYSDVVAESCVKEGTHFLDVTGEAMWVRSVIDRFHDEAVVNNVKVVNFCGFDSVPADLGAYFVANHAKKRYDRHVKRILGGYSIKTAGKIPVSGGTLATMILISTMDKSDRNKMKDPYYLNPPTDKPVYKVSRDQYKARFDEDFGYWTSPFIMQSVNKRVVQRSASFLRDRYGSSFDYAEAVKERSYLHAFISYLFMCLTLFVLFVRPLRRLMFALGWLPKPGEGPSIEAETKSWWKLRLDALLHPDASTPEQELVKVHAEVSDNFGGYTSTARMATECAMCLILDKEKLVQLGVPKGGVLTPAVAFREALIHRLDAIGFQFRIL